MEPKYVANKSVWGEYGGRILLCILLCVLIVPIFFMVYMILKAKSYRIEFYDNKMIVKSGVFNKEERQSMLTTIMGASVEQSLFGRVFNYGNVNVDTVGKWDVSTKAIKDPQGLKRFLESVMATQDKRTLQQIVAN